MKRLLLLLLLLLSSTAHAATQTVGPGKSFATVCAAIAAAANNDIIQIDGENTSGTQLIYTNDICTFTKTGLTIRGVAGQKRPLIRVTTGALAGGIATWYANAAGTSTLTVQHVEMSGAHNLTQSAAPVRTTNTTTTYTDVYMHHNDNGIRGEDELVGGGSRVRDLTINNSEIAYNGAQTGGLNTTAVAHNVNAGQCRTFTIIGTFVHDSRGGDAILSRCNTSYALYNRIADASVNVEVTSAQVQPTMMCTGETAQELHFPIAGLAYVIGNVIYQAPGTHNLTMVHWHSTTPTAGQENTLDELHVVNNTVVNDLGVTTVIGIWTDLSNPSPLTIMNNVFAGFVAGAAVLAQGPTHITQPHPANNLVYATIAGAVFTDANNQNYHLGATSGAIDAATVDPGSAHSFSLTPVSNYVHPRSTDTRTNEGLARDMGAYETNATLGATIDTPQIMATPTTNSIVVRWTPALSDTPLVSYSLFRNGFKITSPLGLLYTDIAPGGGAISYVVSAETASVCGASSPLASAGLIQESQGVLANQIGWQKMRNTNLTTVALPSTDAEKILDRGGMAFDTDQNRVLVFSNGITWASNAVLALSTQTWTVSAVNLADAALGSGAEIVGGGRPNGRQTFNGVAWMPSAKDLFVWGGYRTETGFLTDAWRFTSPNTWTKQDPTGTPPTATMAATANDVSGDKVYLVTHDCLDIYDPFQQNYIRPGSCKTWAGNAITAVTDPVHSRVYACAEFECGYFDMATAAYTAITDSACAPLMIPFPGLVWDSLHAKIIGWVGGKIVYTLDPATNTCASTTFEGDPGYAPTFEVGSRFQYASNLNVFVAATASDKEFYVLRVTLDQPPPPPRLTFGLHGTGALRGKAALRRP